MSMATMADGRAPPASRHSFLIGPEQVRLMLPRSPRGKFHIARVDDPTRVGCGRSSQGMREHNGPRELNWLLVIRDLICAQCFDALERSLVVYAVAER